jgi:hypothetical protein
VLRYFPEQTEVSTSDRRHDILGPEATAMVTKTEDLPAIRDLNPEESWAFFDDKARTLLGITGEEFRRRWNAGEYDAIADDPPWDIMYLAMFLPHDR